MHKLSRVIALSVFGLSGSVIAAEDSDQSRILTNLDSDGDGSVNFAEFQEHRAARLDRIDSDEDGALSLDEFLSARSLLRPRGDRNPDRPEREATEEQVARMEQRKAEMTARATARFQAMDVDGNDIVSLNEFQEANFLELDSDNNGLLTATELRPKRPGRRGSNDPRGGKRPPR
ncbi:MAG: hypothetical protein WDZ52_01455 [Pseudohongiellaceae bacterium]